MVKTSIKFGEKDYALVPDRIKEFREDNPRGSIDTDPTYNADGSITFKATIIKDQADEYSARATGNARYSESELKKPKAFEKLETVATGRALAILGYLNDGQVATTEEMQEFEQYRADKYGEEIEEAKTVEELVAIFKRMDSASKKEFTATLGAKRKELENATTV
jgi:hypothetical protein